jgi:hypothetical protein
LLLVSAAAAAVVPVAAGLEGPLGRDALANPEVSAQHR